MIAPIALMLAALLVATPLPAAAQMTIGEYGELLAAINRAGRDKARVEEAVDVLLQFHDGMDIAIALANAAFVQAGAQPSFCLPAGSETRLELMSKVAKEVLEGKEDWAKQSRASVGQVAIAVLKAEYPCR